MGTFCCSFRILAQLLQSCCVLMPALALLFLIALRFWVKRNYRLHHETGEKESESISIGFFHPYCNAGGGGERVLWCAIRAIQQQYPKIKCVVYTGDAESPKEILKKAQQNFNITISEPVQFVHLRQRCMVEASFYPCFTLLGQSLGSILLGLEAILKFVPTVYIDTMGYAFTLPLFKYIGGCKVSCYVHYPTISTDMLEVVHQKKSSFNNASYISQNAFLSRCKLFYYNLFAQMYGVCGRCADVVVVNSSWTKGNIVNIWKQPHKTLVVFPPCDVKAFEEIPLTHSRKNKVVIVSVAQFRPEKNHRLQIETLSQLLRVLPPEKRENVKLILVGGCRNEGDRKRVESLEVLARSLGLQSHVEFKLNIPFNEVKQCLQDATVGLHTMWNEHFGIGIVECMAAGVIVIGHNSGGPKMDIVVDYLGKPTGFLAATVEEYTSRLQHVIDMSPEEVLEMKTNARSSVQRFSEELFMCKFLEANQKLWN